MQTPARRWRPRWLPVLAMLAILPVLLWLGFWQLDRASQKQVMFDQFELSRTPVDLSALQGLPLTEIRYRRITATGTFVPESQFLLEGMTHKGRPGLHVLTPMRLTSGAVVLVDRGWIPETRTRQTLPSLPVENRIRTIEGRVVAYPQPGLRLASPATEQQWPRRVLYPTVDEIAAALGTEVLPYMVWLASDQPDGFVRQWQPAEFGPARHIGYAVQWFGLAIALLMIYLVLKFRRKGKNGS